MKITRALVPAVVAGALLMTGCTAGGAPTQDTAGNECLAAGDASSALKIKGEVGVDAEITSKTPVNAKKMQRSVLEQGKGDVAKSGDTLSVSMAMFNGADGKSIQQAPASDVPLDEAQLATWAYEGLRCATLGETVAVVVPFADAFGETKAADTGIEGITEKDSVVVVMNVAKAGKTESKDEATAADSCKKLDKRDEKYPEIDLGDGKSEPKITIPECMEAPAELELKVLKEGKGAKVADGDSVMTNYVGVDWNGAVRFDGNWSETGIEFNTGGVIEGFKQAMVGQKIGSIIQVTMPSDLGYQDGMTRTFVLELVSMVK